MLRDPRQDFWRDLVQAYSISETDKPTLDQGQNRQHWCGGTGRGRKLYDPTPPYRPQTNKTKFELAIPGVNVCRSPKQAPHHAVSPCNPSQPNWLPLHLQRCLRFGGPQATRRRLRSWTDPLIETDPVFDPSGCASKSFGSRKRPRAKVWRHLEASLSNQKVDPLPWIDPHQGSYAQRPFPLEPEDQSSPGCR